jgi:hypothetical protein
MLVQAVNNPRHSGPSVPALGVMPTNNEHTKCTVQ